MHNEHYTIAIDIAKDSLRVQTRDGAFDTTTNKPGFKRVCRECAKHLAPRVVMEATGGYERHICDHLHALGIELVVLNPKLLRDFARSEGVKAKNDPIDGRMMLRFATEKHLRPTPAPAADHLQLTDLMDRRNQLVSMLSEEKNRSQKSNGPTRPQMASIKRILKTLEQEIARIEKAIRKVIDQSKTLSALVRVTTSVRGVGEVTAWAILAYLPEIGQVGRAPLAALAGVAPYDDDSGKSSAPRHIQGGRSKARNAIYMATHVAATWNPVIRAYVQRLMARGKPYKCALVAAMRKMLIHIQSLIKKELSALES